MKAKILVYALPVLILATIHFAEAQQSAKVPRIGYLSGASLSAISDGATRHSGKDSASLGMWREKTLSLSGGGRRENLIGCLT